MLWTRSASCEFGPRGRAGIYSGQRALRATLPQVGSRAAVTLGVCHSDAWGHVPLDRAAMVRSEANESRSGAVRFDAWPRRGWGGRCQHPNDYGVVSACRWCHLCRWMGDGRGESGCRRLSRLDYRGGCLSWKGHVPQPDDS